MIYLDGLFSLTDRVALVTGAHGKLGRVWTQALILAGAKVALVDKPDVPVLSAPNLEGNSCAYGVDIRDRAALERLLQQVEQELGPVDILVNNAGIDQPPTKLPETHLLEDFPIDTFREVLSVNLEGAYQCMQVFGAAMVRRNRGSIINIGSLYAGVSPDARFYSHVETDPPFLKPPAYGASKAGLINLTKYFATHWGGHSVRVNALSPGGVLGGQDDDFKKKFNDRVPLGRMADLQDLVGPLLFLASDASSYVTGQELLVDGGFTVW